VATVTIVTQFMWRGAGAVAFPQRQSQPGRLCWTRLEEITEMEATIFQNKNALYQEGLRLARKFLKVNRIPDPLFYTYAEAEEQVDFSSTTQGEFKQSSIQAAAQSCRRSSGGHNDWFVLGASHLCERPSDGLACSEATGSELELARMEDGSNCNGCCGARAWPLLGGLVTAER
jgi:hypothetical protein